MKVLLERKRELLKSMLILLQENINKNVLIFLEILVKSIIVI